MKHGEYLQLVLIHTQDDLLAVCTHKIQLVCGLHDDSAWLDGSTTIDVLRQFWSLDDFGDAFKHYVVFCSSTKTLEEFPLQHEG